jgi:hypothetical protein
MSLRKSSISEKSFHLAGIVPVAGQKLDFECPWHDSLMPIAPNYLAVERAVLECAWAGCETIWIVCNDDIQPLIRYRLGDYVFDPVSLRRQYGIKPTDEKRPITIYYVPVHPNDREKRDCLSWSVLYGAKTSFDISKQISTWIAPDRYYVAFPYGVYDPEVLRQRRMEISTRRGFFLSYNDTTVRDGKYLGFTFDAEDYSKFMKVIRSATGEKVPGQDISGGYPKEKLPLHKRWSARYFSLDKVFQSAKVEKANIQDVSWYYDIDSWERYSKYMASGVIAVKPAKCIMTYREWNSIGVNNSE